MSATMLYKWVDAEHWTRTTYTNEQQEIILTALAKPIWDFLVINADPRGKKAVPNVTKFPKIHVIDNRRCFEDGEWLSKEMLAHAQQATLVDQFNKPVAETSSFPDDQIVFKSKKYRVWNANRERWECPTYEVIPRMRETHICFRRDRKNAITLQTLTHEMLHIRGYPHGWVRMFNESFLLGASDMTDRLSVRIMNVVFPPMPKKR